MSAQQDEAAFMQRVAEAIRHVVRGYCTAGWQRFRQDMEQEAWLRILEDRPGYDPTRCSVFNWACMVASRHLVHVLGRMASPVYLPRSRIRKEEVQSCPLDDQGQARAGRSPDQPDRRLQQAEGERARLDWFQQVRSRIGQILAGWPERDGQICRLLLGLEGPALRPHEVAKVLGCRVERVYRAHQQLEREIKATPQMYLLARQMGDQHGDEEETDQTATG